MMPGSLHDRLQHALDLGGNTHTVHDVGVAVRSGQAQYWGHTNTLAVTEVIEYPQLAALRIWLVAGDLKGCGALLPELEEYARSLGCTRIEAMGRIGWIEWGAANGFLPAGTLYRKDLIP